MWPATAALARLGELSGHRGDQSVEPCLAGKLGMEGCGDHVALAHGDDAPVFELRENVNVGPDTLDHRRADEHGVYGTIAENRHVELRLEAFQLATEGVSLDRDVEQ